MKYFNRSLVKSDIDSLLYRKFRLEDKYDQIQRLLSGSDQRYVDLIRTSSGKYSQAKVKKLVNDLMECLVEYKSYSIPKEDISEAFKKIELSKDERSFYEAFFHLVVGLALYNRCGSDTKMFVSGTWNSIIEHIEGFSVYNDRSEMFTDIICNNTIGNLSFSHPDLPVRRARGTFYDIMSAYSELTGSIDGLISEAGKKEAYKEMTKDERSLLRQEEKNPGTIQAMHRDEEEILNNMSWDVEFPDDPIIKEDDFDKDYSETHKPRLDNTQKVEEWHRYFSDVDCFRSECSIVIERIVDMIKNHELQDEAKNAVDIYLARNGHNRWLDDEDYFTVYTYLNKALRASEKRMGNR